MACIFNMENRENAFTFNLYYASNTGRHSRYDIWTWVKFGTSVNDPTTPVQRAYKLASGSVTELIKSSIKFSPEIPAHSY